MLEVNIDKIIPVTEARDSLNNIIDIVENSDDLYVITKNGKPAAIIVGVHHLEKLTGIDHKEIMPETDGVSLNSISNATTTNVASTQTDDQNAAKTDDLAGINSKADDDFTVDQPSDVTDDIFAPAPVATQQFQDNNFSVPPLDTPVNPIAPSAQDSSSFAMPSTPSVEEFSQSSNSFDQTPAIAIQPADSVTTATSPAVNIAPSSNNASDQFSVPTKDTGFEDDSALDDIFGPDTNSAPLPNQTQSNQPQPPVNNGL